jgi:hypothetical protein
LAIVATLVVTGAARCGCEKRQRPLQAHGLKWICLRRR